MASILKVNTIQDATNSNTAMTIDSSGRVKTPNVIHFHVKGSGGWIDHGSSDVTFFKTSTQAVDIQTNVDSCYDASTGRFTVPSGMDGLYQFNCNLYANDSGDSSNTGRIIKNGSAWTDTFFLVANADDYSDNTIEFGWIMSLVAGDYVNIAVRNDIYASHSYWMGFFVG